MAHGRSIALLTVMTVSTVSAAQTFPPECPDKGTMEIVANPADWADKCFMAVTGRAPTFVGESYTFYRDIDLDGVLERIEVRGTGNSSNPIYVFDKSAKGYAYIGEFNAHRSFEVRRDSNGQPIITYLHRFGFGHIEEVSYRYVGNEFVRLD